MHMRGEYREFWGFRGHGQRAKRGDMVPIILRVLLKQPMHGYEIISRLEEKSHGLWKPSAGSIYPNLQMLEEKGLVTSAEENGKKVYSLTDEGKQAAEKIDETFKAHWEDKFGYAQNIIDLRSTIKETFGLIHKIAKDGSDETRADVKKIMEEANQKLSKLIEKD